MGLGLDFGKWRRTIGGVMTPSELRDEISKRGLDQRGMASLLGVTESAVSRWLSGDRKIPGPVAVALNGTGTAQFRRKKPSKS